jgi:hypothetical protein
MRKKEINWEDVKTFAIIAVLVLVLIGLFGFMIYESTEYERWYNSLSAEEKAEVDRQRDAEYQSNIHTYEVIGVSKYVRVETNSRGGVMDTDICYTFEYIDGNGDLKHVEGFEHLEYGLTKVVLGETDAYIVNTNGEDTRTLQLTKETLKNIQTLNSG